MVPQGFSGKIMDSTSESISKVVALLTAITTEQEDIAYEMVLEMDPIELFSALTGVLLSVLNKLSETSGLSVEYYLQELGKLAVNMKRNEY
jgi:hypothetical protein